MAGLNIVFPRQLVYPYENFILYPDGRLFNLESQRFITAGLINSGYLMYRIYCHGGMFRWLVHRLVATYFVANPNNLPVVNHKDGNRLNNDFRNLEWCTQQQNLFCAQLQGRMHDRILNPYRVTDLISGKTGIFRTLKQCFDFIDEPTSYCYYSSKMKYFWMHSDSAVPYEFKHYRIERLTEIHVDSVADI